MKDRAINEAADRQRALGLSSAEAAMYLALIRKRRAMTAKGRTMSDRAMRQWFAKRMAHDVARISLEAARITARARYTPEEHCAVFEWWLRERLLAEIYPKQGPIRKQEGLLKSVMPVSASSERGRPRRIDPTAERRWLAFIYGVKAALYAKREWFQSVALKVLLENLSRRAGGAQLRTAYLDAEVSDREVLTRPLVQAQSPASSLSALKARLRRARSRQSYVLPDR